VRILEQSPVNFISVTAKRVGIKALEWNKGAALVAALTCTKRFVAIPSGRTLLKLSSHISTTNKTVGWLSEQPRALLDVKKLQLPT
jgi:hypothetical protein